ncbi:DKNYY domain-containing protein [Thalassolituus marinus]|uniref:DKNYY domain-containing protein n=1 Tax=Thalassolituus marinus TaxID=671053 RepID=A0ABS7ZT06_9GAMM|nr:DKNYY domain-containing protein [Thalassolituus marinus]MCA6064750.1 DKNYY domain-containing protein [Thalassolituus marinus]
MKSKQKECASCNRKSASEMLVCQNCQRPFLDEVDTYLLLFGGVFSLIAALVLEFTVDDVSFFILGIAINVVVIMLGLFVIKMIQKLRDPERKVIKEVFYNIYQSRTYIYYLVFALAFMLGCAFEYVGVPESDFLRASDQYSLILTDYLSWFFCGWLSLSILIFRRGMIVRDEYSYLVEREYVSFSSKFLIAKQYKDQFRIYSNGQSRVVDRDSFKSLGRIYSHDYSKDKNGIYLDTEKVLPNADINSFELLFHPDDRFAYYGRDRDSVYYLDDESPTVLAEVDPQRVRVLYDGLLLAADQLYIKGKRVLEVKDPDSFEMLDDGLARDSMHLYYIGGDDPHVVDGVDPESMTIYDGYVFDNGKSYCANEDQFKRCELATKDQLNEWLEIGVISDVGYCEGLDRLDVLRRSEGSTGKSSR